MSERYDVQTVCCIDRILLGDVKQNKATTITGFKLQCTPAIFRDAELARKKENKIAGAPSVQEDSRAEEISHEEAIASDPRYTFTSEAILAGEASCHERVINIHITRRCCSHFGERERLHSNS